MKTLVYNKSTKTFSGQEDMLREYGLIPYEISPIRGTAIDEGRAAEAHKLISHNIKHTKTVNEFNDDYYHVVWDWKQKMQKKDGCEYRVVMRGIDNRWIFTK